MTSLITTGIGLATTYGVGASSAVIGAGSAYTLKSPMRLREAEITRLDKISRCLTAHIALYQNKPASPIKNAIVLPTSVPEDDTSFIPEEGDCLLSVNMEPNDSAAWLNSIDREAATIDNKDKGSRILPMIKVFSNPSTELSYRITLEKYKALVDKRLKYEQTLQGIDKGNKLSSLSQGAMGAGKIAEATSAIGHATLGVSQAALGFSILSSFLYLCSSVYGVYSFSKQLSENRQNQAHIEGVMEKLRDRTQIETSPAQKQLDAFELSHLEKELATLKNEENLLIQARNTQLLHLTAALLGLTATILFIVGTHGFGVFAYYALSVGSGVFPLIATAYSRFSTNPEKHQQEQAKIVSNPEPSPPQSEQLIQGHMPYFVQDTVSRNLKLPAELEEVSCKLFEQIIEDDKHNPFAVEAHVSNLLTFVTELNTLLLEKELESRKFATGTEITEFSGS